MIYLLFTLIAFAKELPGEEIYTAPKSQVQSPSQKLTPQKRPKATGQAQALYSSNLPTDYQAPLTRQSTASELVLPPKGSLELFRGVRVGDTLSLRVNHSVIAFNDEKSPVVAEGISPSLRGMKFIGESTLEPNSHRIFLNFTRLAKDHRIYNFKASGLTNDGQPGLKGEYHSREAEYFAGDFVANFAAGYFDGLIPRRTNVFGQVETDTSLDSAVKKGLSSGALSTAERFKEKLKRVPEFSEIQGPFDLKILILEPATTTN